MKRRTISTNNNYRSSTISNHLPFLNYYYTLAIAGRFSVCHAISLNFLCSVVVMEKLLLLWCQIMDTLSTPTQGFSFPKIPTVLNFLVRPGWRYSTKKKCWPWKISVWELGDCIAYSTHCESYKNRHTINKKISSPMRQSTSICKMIESWFYNFHSG